MNLYEETMDNIRDIIKAINFPYNNDVSDDECIDMILFVAVNYRGAGSRIEYVEIPLDDFIEQAKHINYDSGYGNAEVNESLIIALKNGGYFERREYDGSEWWEYEEAPVRPDKFADRPCIMCDWWYKENEVGIDYVR